MSITGMKGARSRAMIKVLSVLSFALVVGGCAVTSETSENGEDAEQAPVTQTNEAALSTGAGDPGGGGDTVGDGSGGAAEKPKFDLASCITTRMLLEGWSRGHATAFCKCKAKGYSDAHCAYVIPYIDL